MWLITNFGFFSVVQKPGEKQLTIRARVKKDLENLRQKYIPNLGETLEGVGTDYRYRAKVSHEDFAEATKKMVFDIDYSNFKNSVAAKQGEKRERIYHKVWATLLDLEREV